MKSCILSRVLIVKDEMISKLNIEKIAHGTPYRVYGMNNNQWVDVKEQAYISFSIGSYCDTILCDVMPLGDCHVILGRIWQVDVRSLYDGSKNTYVINKNGQEFVMSSLQDDKATWGMSRTWLMGRREFLKHKEHEDEEAKVKSPFEGQEDKRR
jgi:hypothetical protein